MGSHAAGAGAPVSGAGDSMAGKVVRASAWSMGGYGASQTLRFAGNLVLTRLMAPEVFGLVAIVQTFIYGLQMFSDVGTGPAVVQSPHGDRERFLDTAWTVQCIRGGLLFLGTCAIAVPVARFYEQPLLAWLLPAAGIGSIFDGFASMSLHTAVRHIRVQWTIFVELTTQLVNIITIVLLTLVLRDSFGVRDIGLVWAAVGGTVVGEFTRMTLSHLVVPGIRHRFLLDPESRKVLFSFGRWVFFSTILMFLATQSDRLVFGKMIPLELLGVYGIAAALGSLPAQAVQRLASSVLFPAYSRRQEREDFHRVFWRARFPVLLAGATLVSGLVASGPFFIRLLYDARYEEAGPSCSTSPPLPGSRSWKRRTAPRCSPQGGSAGWSGATRSSLWRSSRSCRSASTWVDSEEPWWASSSPTSPSTRRRPSAPRASAWAVWEWTRCCRWSRLRSPPSGSWPAWPRWSGTSRS